MVKKKKKKDLLEKYSRRKNLSSLARTKPCTDETLISKKGQTSYVNEMNLSKFQMKWSRYRDFN